MKKIAIEDIWHDTYDGLDTHHHFSFANYYDPGNMNYGDIRVINDDTIEGGNRNGIGLHPHVDMEIITYIVSGQLTHGDSLGNERTIGEGMIQYMSAGKGIYHSEHNYGEKDLRLLQIWIQPDKKGYEPKYADYNYDIKNRKNKFFHLISERNRGGFVEINQDVDIFIGEFDRDTTYAIPDGKKVYGVVVEGEGNINNETLNIKDAFKEEGDKINIGVKKRIHIILFQTNK